MDITGGTISSVDYDQLLAADRVDALMLGVKGHDDRANAERAEVARVVSGEANRREERSHTGPWVKEEFELAGPFGCYAVADAYGDVAQAVKGEGFESDVRHHMGIAGEKLVYDDDGAHYVEALLSSDELEAAQAEVERIRTVVSDRVSRAMEPPHVSHTAERDRSAAPSKESKSMEMPEGTYRELVAANRIHALLLGVEGHDVQANARRAAVASEVVAEAGRREEAAYAKAHWMNEPNIAKPFAAHLIAAAGRSRQRAGL